MPTDIVIDPITKTFVEDGTGGWVESDDSRTAVFCQIESELDAWCGDPSAGSDNAKILRSTDPIEIQDLIDSTRRAMTVMVNAGIVGDLTVSELDTDTAPFLGIAAMLLQWRDRASDKTVDLIYPSIGRP